VKKLAIPMMLIAALGMGVVATLGGCKQGEGERCQVDDDCADGTCNQATSTCATSGTDKPIDAAAPPDGPPSDTIDAPDDAPPDAPDAN
jgi:hypothetical protein